jgi:hypothetical protein
LSGASPSRTQTNSSARIRVTTDASFVVTLSAHADALFLMYFSASARE